MKVQVSFDSGVSDTLELLAAEAGMSEVVLLGLAAADVAAGRVTPEDADDLVVGAWLVEED